MPTFFFVNEETNELDAVSYKREVDPEALSCLEFRTMVEWRTGGGITEAAKELLPPHLTIEWYAERDSLHSCCFNPLTEKHRYWCSQSDERVAERKQAAEIREKHGLTHDWTPLSEMLDEEMHPKEPALESVVICASL